MVAKQASLEVDSQTKNETRERILTVAEDLFSKSGIEAVSLRTLTTAAKVNVAAAHYHFGSKYDIVEEIFRRREEPIASRRRELLSQCREAPSLPPLLEQIISAYILPALEAGRDPASVSYLRLRARLAYDDAYLRRREYYRTFEDSSAAFIKALQKELPHLSREEMYWRFHFLLGTMTYTMANPGRIQMLSDGLCDPGDVEQALNRMVPFLAAGFRAPMPPAKKPARKS